jgi:hypothetical protein
MDVRRLEFDQVASRPSIELREGVFFFLWMDLKYNKRVRLVWLVDDGD